METKIILIKLFIWPFIVTIFSELPITAPFAIFFYLIASFGVIYTVIIPKYKRDKKHKQWVKDGCKKEDRYKWEDVQ